MPTYAYRCSACDHRFDAVQRMVDDPLTECPNCGGFVRRLIQNVPVVFKGSGWYVTDSRKSKDAKTTDTTSEPAASENGVKPSETAKTAKTETAASSKPATATAAAD